MVLVIKGKLGNSLLVLTFRTDRKKTDLWSKLIIHRTPRFVEVAVL